MPMAASHLPLQIPTTTLSNFNSQLHINSPFLRYRPRCEALNGATVQSTAQPARRGRKKKTHDSESPPDSGVKNEEVSIEGFDDGVDFPYDDPPLLCCFGAALKEFVPSVRVSDNQMDPDIYSDWKMLQWDPPEFARAPGGPVSNVAIAHVRLGGRAAFIGKVGSDEYGKELVLMMNKEKVQTRGVKFDVEGKTGRALMKARFDDGKLKMEMVKEAPEDSFSASELNLSVLKEARVLHFNSEVLMSSSAMRSALFNAIALSKKFGGLIFFDLNMILPMWKLRDATRELIKEAWNQADVVEVSRQELEFLLDEEYFERKRNYKPQYYAENFEQIKARRDYYHYTREEIAPLWHEGLKILLVTYGTLRLLLESSRSGQSGEFEDSLEKVPHRT